MIRAFLSRLVILTFATLYPAYASYKALRTANVAEYFEWITYWIAYAMFKCFEVVTDQFLSWFPLYYEVKVVIALWLLSYAIKGNSTLYRIFIHPALARHEQLIDKYLNQVKECRHTAVVELGARAVNYATNVIRETAIRALQYGFGSGAANNQFQGLSLPSLPSPSIINNRNIYNNNEYNNENYGVTDFMFALRSLSWIMGRQEPFVEYSDEDDEFIRRQSLRLQSLWQQQNVSHSDVKVIHTDDNDNDNAGDNDEDNDNNKNINVGGSMGDTGTVDGGSSGHAILARNAKAKPRSRLVSKRKQN